MPLLTCKQFMDELSDYLDEKLDVDVRKKLEQHINAYIKAYNDKAQPFVWTKKKVRQHRFKGRRITQL